MKIVYRVFILLAVFSGALVYFGRNMKERVFSVERKTISMQEATLPVVTVQVEGEELNLLHGYCSNLDAMLLRESITPIGEEKNFMLLIAENGYNIKKVNFEVYETAEGAKVEEGSVISLDKQMAEKNGKGVEQKTAKIRLKGEYAIGEEYVVKLTLISNESKRIYYYTRIKPYNDSHLSEKLAYVSMFHSSLLNKEDAKKVSRYLETERNAEETDFSIATIHNSLDFLSYGQMAPAVLFEEPPTITEYTKDMASVVLGFYLTVDTPAGTEVYYVKEYFRFQYTPARFYLYNYERHMEGIFDVAATSLAKSEFKFGITADTEPELLPNQDNSRIAFVRNGALYIYTVSDNTLTTAFTFAQSNTDYVRDTYDKHGIRLLSVDDAGTVDFLVYGYMNRGEYEGRVGMVLYTYHPSDQSVEERAYFPMNTTYEILKEVMGEFFYCSAQDIFYFHIYDTIYSYNLVAGKLEAIAKNVPEDHMIYSKARQTIAWQSETEFGRSGIVHVMNLDTGEVTSLCGEDGEILGLLGMIDGNPILGTAKEEDIEIREDGTRLAAFPLVDIVDFEGNVLKRYHKEGYYVIAATTEDNVVLLERVMRANASSSKDARKYQPAEEDYILKQADLEVSPVKVSKRVTEQMRTEYYLSLPDSAVMEGMPKTAVTKNAVITKDVTVRINLPSYFSNYYITYAYGNIVLLSKEAGEAIALADASTGTVIGSNGRVIWSRGIKSASAELSGVGGLSSQEAQNSLMACVKKLLSYRNAEVNVADYHPEQMLLDEWMEQYVKADVIKLNGVTLDEALYYVYRKNPIIAVSQEGSAILVTGYDKTSITALIPSQGGSRRLSLREAENFLGESGYYFLVVE